MPPDLQDVGEDAYGEPLREVVVGVNERCAWRPWQDEQRVTERDDDATGHYLQYKLHAAAEDTYGDALIVSALAQAEGERRRSIEM